MPEEKPAKTIIFDTHDIPTIYVNQAQLTMSYHELRIYLSETGPKQIILGKSKMPTEAKITPKLSLVMTPEFGKALLDALNNTVGQYEAQFGQLRKKPTEESNKTDSN